MSHGYSAIHSTASYSPASHPVMADQTSQSRQPSNAYPSPHSYPSPSMQPTYTYPPPQGQAAQEPYRGSPQGSNMSLPPLNLPPIRLQDGGQAQPPPQPQQGPPSMGSPLPPPQHPLPQYYHAAHPPPGMAMPPGPHLQMRYQLPPQGGDQRILSGGRHKKEIKRRTKTGCLTCRKRRIKVRARVPVACSKTEWKGCAKGELPRWSRPTSREPPRSEGANFTVTSSNSTFSLACDKFANYPSPSSATKRIQLAATARRANASV
jgi:hypothetical protein